MALTPRRRINTTGYEHPKWGPDFDTYLEVFERRFDQALKDYLASREVTSVAHDGLIPLAVLETMLSIGDNMHKLQYQHGDRSLPVLMDIVMRYTELNDSFGIFDYYYGYLCMRHIMRTICIGTLLGSGTLEGFLNQIDPKTHVVDPTGVLAEEAFDQLSEYLFKNDVSYIAVGMGLQSPNWDHALTCVGGGLNFDDVQFLILALWKNRRQLITLIERGMVPGFPALLFVLTEMTMLSKVLDSIKQWDKLQEILLRAYIVGTREE
ncbi:hypothetical protein RhiJN_20198 [Ceratobasidium sp. AG-Ba]|nr:hypothetical protein RhiJN_20198 [Ceratobasidium sp. AG-Ba]